MELLFFLVALFACTIGNICGMGGGVIIKPVLDAFHVYPVATINFLSGCTVLGMSLWSVMKVYLKKESAIELKTSSYLAVSAALGGLTGKSAFNSVASLFADRNTAGGVQACVLLAATFLTFLYTLNKKKIASRRIENPIACLLIGFLLGNFGAFLGIGGGPFNIAVLYYFFSMTSKKAAQNSLYIIVFSQATSLLKTAISNAVPSVSIFVLIGMIFCGILGSECGRKINRKLSEEGNTRLFEAAMILVMAISVYNIFRLL